MLNPNPHRASTAALSPPAGSWLRRLPAAAVRAVGTQNPRTANGSRNDAAGPNPNPSTGADLPEHHITVPKRAG